jgi:hypothetical protein
MLKNRQQEVDSLERDRDALLASWSASVPEDLERLTPEERNTLYHRLRLEIKPQEEGYEITGPFCSLKPISSVRGPVYGPFAMYSSSFASASPASRMRAVP